MADFKDVVKSLKDNKTSQDDGFNRLEAAVKGTDPKSIQEEQKKTQNINKKKEQGYFKAIGDEVSELNKNFVEGFKSLKGPEGIAGGFLGMLTLPFLLIKGFLEGLGDSFRKLTQIFTKTKIGSALFYFMNETLPDFFKKVFGKNSRLGKMFSDVKGFGKMMAGPFIGMFNDLKKFFTPNPRTASIIKDTFRFIMEPIEALVKLFKGIGEGSKTGKFIKGMMETFGKVNKFIGTFGRLIGRLFLPITFIMTAFDTITGAIDGFTNTEGNIVQQMLGAMGGAIKGFMKIVTIPLDLVKDLISWIAGKFGFTEFEKLLDGFSFTEMFGKVVDWLYVDLPKFFFDLFSWQGIKDTLSGALDFANEIGKSLQRLIHKGLNWIKGIFGFGDDDSDFATATGKFDEGPLDIVFGFVNKFFSWLKGLFDIDVGKILKSFVPDWAMKWFEGGSTNQDEGMELQQERTNRIKELKRGLKEGKYDGLFTDSKDEIVELKKLEQEEKDYFAKIRAGSADKGNLKTANLVGQTPSLKIPADHLDIENMSEEDVKKASKVLQKLRSKTVFSKRSQFDKDNEDTIKKLTLRRQEFRDQAEEEGNIAGKITQAQLDKIVVGGGGSSTVVNNTTNAPVNNNNTSSSYSPPTNPDPTIERAKMAAFR